MTYKLHRTRIVERKGVGLTVQVAFCSCGWESAPYPSVAKAQEVADDHVVYVTRHEPSIRARD